MKIESHDASFRFLARGRSHRNERALGHFLEAKLGLLIRIFVDAFSFALVSSIIIFSIYLLKQTFLF